MNAPQAPNDRQRLLDQQVLAVLRSGGGWNARTRARLASLAKRAGVDVQVVVASAMRAASMGGGAPAGVRTAWIRAESGARCCGAWRACIRGVERNVRCRGGFIALRALRAQPCL